MSVTDQQPPLPTKEHRLQHAQLKTTTLIAQNAAGQHPPTVPAQSAPKAKSPATAAQNLDPETQKDMEYAVAKRVREMAVDPRDPALQTAAKNDPKDTANAVREHYISHLSDPGVKQALAEAHETRLDVEYLAAQNAKRLAADPTNHTALAEQARKNPAIVAKGFADQYAANLADPNMQAMLQQAHQKRIAESTAQPAKPKPQSFKP